MTLQFPHTFDDTQPVGGQDLQDALDMIATQFPVSLGSIRQARFGTGTITWPGGLASSNTINVSHGLSVTPGAVLVASITSSGLTQIPVLQSGLYTSTQFSVAAGTVDGQTPLASATTGFAWLAVA